MLFFCTLSILYYTINGDPASVFDPARSIIAGPLTKSRPISRHRRHVTNPQITDMYVTSIVTSRFATVTVSSKVVNFRDSSLEATFRVHIPESAFISNFSMVINDKLRVSKVYDKKHAQQKYDRAKSEGQSAGQVRHQTRDVARGMDVFNINVNVATRSDVHFELTYQELLERRLGLYQQRIMVQPLQVVNNLTLDLTFNEPQEFERFTYREPNSTELNVASSRYTVLTSTPSMKRLIYKPSVSKQTAVSAQKGIDGEFVVTYDVGHQFDGGNIIYAQNNDYFIHYFAVDKSPEISVFPKNILFVIDISGSMSGRKIEQTRDAMKAILLQLASQDYFNILLFDVSQEIWQNSPIQATPGNINLAQSFVETRVRVRGGTNIDGAMVESVKMVANDPELSGKAGIIVFLTDGQPTSGETNKLTIRRNIKNMNENRVAVFSLGFGMGVDFTFLQKVSWENGGFARRIYEEADAANQLTNFYKEVSNPLLQDVEFRYPLNQVREADVTRTTYKQVFSGTEIIVSGKKTSERIDATVHGSTTSNIIELVVPDNSKTEIAGPSGEFTEKLWAYLTIKDLLRKKAIAISETEARDLEARALKMSLKYNFVTPLTSFLVVEDELPKKYANGNRYMQMQNSVTNSKRSGWKKTNMDVYTMDTAMDIDSQSYGIGRSSHTSASNASDRLTSAWMWWLFLFLFSSSFFQNLL